MYPPILPPKPTERKSGKSFGTWLEVKKKKSNQAKMMEKTKTLNLRHYQLQTSLFLP